MTQSTTSEPQNLVERLTNEISRVAKIRDIYISVPGGGGQIAAAMMMMSLNTAIKALGSNDIVEMISAVQDLEGYEL